MSSQISIKLHDLISASRSGKLKDVVEREKEMARLARALLRPSHHHVALVAEPGTGKSSLIDAFATRLLNGHFRPIEPKLYRLNTQPIASLLVNGENMRQCVAALTQATSQLDSAIIAIEDLQLLTSGDPTRLELTMAMLEALASHPGIRLIITMTSSAYHRVFRDDYTFARTFEVIELQPATTPQAIAMTHQAVPRLEALNRQHVASAAIDLAVDFGARFGHGRALPDAAIRLLEEACVKAALDGRSNVCNQDIEEIVAERENLPLRDLANGHNAELASIEPELLKAVVGQAPALKIIARTIAKSQLGLGDTSKPRGSFLLLGPSGVGKTETAKALTRVVFSNPQAFIRLDMSEYAEPHSAIRLIGSPPGYVGYDEGGQLTGAVSKQPYSLVLLDEIEKAHPKLFDLFLQLLDDGRLTDSAGHTVDFTETLVLATSNTGAHEIAAAATEGIDINSPVFLQQTLMPLLLNTYRPEFINRFDAILVYQPLSLQHMISLAQRELGRLQDRLSGAQITFQVTPETLASMLLPGLNPLFGARPVKRLISTRFETPIADRMIRGELGAPLVITGLEPWITEGASW
jgi:ATP-dependent Clp protease ATP-binding subunit ClpC